jgi:hypothetical protein
MTILREVCNPNVLAVYRLVIAESDPEIAHVLDSAGREGNHAAKAEEVMPALSVSKVADAEPALSAPHY